MIIIKKVDKVNFPSSVKSQCSCWTILHTGSSASFVMDANLWAGQIQVLFSYLLCKELSDMYNDICTVMTFSKTTFPWNHVRCFKLPSPVRGENYLLLSIHYLKGAPWSIVSLPTVSSRMIKRKPETARTCLGLAMLAGEWLWVLPL